MRREVVEYTKWKWYDLISADNVARLVEEAFRTELLRLLPVVRVHVCTVQVHYHLLQQQGSYRQLDPCPFIWTFSKKQVARKSNKELETGASPLAGQCTPAGYRHKHMQSAVNSEWSQGRFQGGPGGPGPSEISAPPPPAAPKTLKIRPPLAKNFR